MASIIIFTGFSILIVFIDVKIMRIPLWATWLGSFLILVVGTWYYSLLSGLCLALMMSFTRFITNNGLGGGDIHYSFFCGCFTGLFLGILGMWVAATLAIAFFLIRRFLGHKSTKIPFAPFMFLGSIVVYLLNIYKPIVP